MNTPNQLIAHVTSPTPTYVSIDPAMAERLLQSNTKNRTLRRSRVERYAADMKAGNWRKNTDAIAIATDGTILNGQHRLYAIIQSGVPIDALFVSGLPPESMKVIDSGLARTAGDYFRASGVQTNANLLAAITKLVAIRDNNGLWNTTKASRTITNSVLEETLEKYPQITESTRSTNRVLSKISAPGRVLGFAHFLIAEANNSMLADYFFDQLITPVNEPEGSAVFAITSRLRTIRDNKQRYEAPLVTAMIIRGWNAYAQDEPVRHLSVAGGGRGFAMPEARKWSRPVPLIRSDR